MSGFVDIQINGAFGVDFNGDDLNLESVQFACAELEQAGTRWIYPTLITAPWETMLRRIRRWVELLRLSPILQQMVAGLHIEGPFLSDKPGFVGAHPADCTLDAEPDLARELLDAGQGWIKIVTLSPERDLACNTIRFLNEAQVRVFAGHTDASLDQLQAAIDHGLIGFTHLGNGTPLLLHRHDNILQRVLYLKEHLWITLIADGHHLPWFVLENLLDVLPPSRSVIVSDAIMVAGQGPGQFRWGTREIDVLEDGACWDRSRSHFVGSATLLHQMAAHLSSQLGYSASRIAQLCQQNATSFLGLNL